MGGEGYLVSITCTLSSPPADFVTKDPALESDLSPPRLVLNHALTSSAKWRPLHHEWLRNETRDTTARRMVEGVLCGPRGPLAPLSGAGQRAGCGQKQGPGADSGWQRALLVETPPPRVQGCSQTSRRLRHGDQVTHSVQVIFK